MKEEPNKDVSPVKEAPRSLQIKPPQLTPEER